MLKPHKPRAGENQCLNFQILGAGMSVMLLLWRCFVLTLQVHHQMKAYYAFVAEAFANKLGEAPIYHGNEWQETLWSLNFRILAFLVIWYGKKKKRKILIWLNKCVLWNIFLVVIFSVKKVALLFCNFAWVNCLRICPPPFYKWWAELEQNKIPKMLVGGES